MHVHYPYGFDDRGRTASSQEAGHIRELVEQVLFTAPGERVNRPDFGCGLLGLVFEPAGDVLAAATAMAVQGALQQWLGELIQVDAVSVEAEDAVVRVSVDYVIRKSGDQVTTEFFEKPMSGHAFKCANANRRKLVSQQFALNGIDFLEVASTDQRNLRLSFIHALPGQPNGVPPAAPSLAENNLRIEGGFRRREIGIVPGSLTILGRVITFRVTEAGDFSTYTLRVVGSGAGDAPPAGFDPQLSRLGFSFKATCPSDFDCEPSEICPPDIFAEPALDYLSKDYESFRRLMLDRLAVTLPDWRERSPADLMVALVELLSYVGDNLSQYQDAVATEAYLGTARQRISVRRHAKLVDYIMHEGSNARAWVAFELDPLGPEQIELERGTQLLTKADRDEVRVRHDELLSMLPDGPIVFETMHDAVLKRGSSRVEFYTWGDSACCLPTGSTRATLASHPQEALELRAGDWLLMEEVLSPTTGEAHDADRTHRHVVRLTDVTDSDAHGQALVDPLTGQSIVEVAWSHADALPFPLCLSAIASDGTKLDNVSRACANVVLADHGRTVSDTLEPPRENDPSGPRLPRTPLTFQGVLDRSSAQSAFERDLRKLVPAVELTNAEGTWRPRADLLRSGPFDLGFVVEMDSAGVAWLRFGDDLHGRKPKSGGFVARYRIGNGAAGNIGPGALEKVVTGVQGIDRVWNPLPARGGREAETMEEARRKAPSAFRAQERAVTEADYAAIAQRSPLVQKARATRRWTGSWPHRAHDPRYEGRRP